MVGKYVREAAEFSKFKNGEVLYLTIDDLPLTPAVAIVRIDINRPMKGKEAPLADLRLRAHAETLRELSDKGWIVLVLAHQGRPGKPDFVPLKNHARALSRLCGKKVIYPWSGSALSEVLPLGEKAVFNDRIEKMLKSLKPGDIFLFENTRFLKDEQATKSPEEHARHWFLQKLKGLFPDAVFVFDAFAAIHREHMSIIGPMTLWPTYAGRVLVNELEAIRGAIEKSEPERVLVCGGAKADDSLKYVERLLKQGLIDKVLTCGVVGEIFLHAAGYSLNRATLEFLKGLFDKERAKSERIFSECLADAENLLAAFGGKIVLPLGVAADVGGKRVEFKVDEKACAKKGGVQLKLAFDAGSSACPQFVPAFRNKKSGELIPEGALIKDIDLRTAYFYVTTIMNAKTVIVNGPAGVYEEKEFRRGTRTLTRGLMRAADNEGLRTIVGGADIIAAMEASGVGMKHAWTISVGGKAFFDVATVGNITGIPVIRALRDYTFRWHAHRLSRMRALDRIAANGSRTGEKTPTKI